MGIKKDIKSLAKLDKKSVKRIKKFILKHKGKKIKVKKISSIYEEFFGENRMLRHNFIELLKKHDIKIKKTKVKNLTYGPVDINDSSAVAQHFSNDD